MTRRKIQTPVEAPVDPFQDSRFAPALNAWKRCGHADADHWPKVLDKMLIATWRGQEIAWPQFEGEGFGIFRIADSVLLQPDPEYDDDGALLDPDTYLSDQEAQSLHWHEIKAQPAIRW